MKFAEIAGYDSIKSHLLKSVEKNHVAHAIMFSSVEGGAGLQMAIAFATYLNCENPGSTDSCGECPSCHKMEKLIHPDINFFFPIARTKAFPKDPMCENFYKDWREFFEKKPFGTWIDWGKFIGAENKQLFIPKEESKRILSISSMKAFEAEFKINIIWLPEYLNLYSANALLKIIEEPPPKTIFLLITENSEKILPTILSRTQVMRLPPYTIDEMAEILDKKYSIEKEKAQTIAQIARGNVNEAIELSSEVENTKHLMIREWLLSCHGFKTDKLIKEAENFHKRGRESQKAFMRLALSMLRESLAASAGKDDLLNVPENQKDFVKKLNKNSGWEKIAAISEVIDKAYYHLERNLYAKIVFLDTSLLISSIFRS